MPIPFYRCDRCHREYGDWEEAHECEKAHLLPVSVEVKQYTHRPYPYSLFVSFNDGTTRVYNAEDLGG